ncbi:MAG TPA: PAS domain-containing sensor histidine kinase [Bauldia sp.]|nr:PAS domain-containing sensor histidine kinase [Bauldia sp.]
MDGKTTSYLGMVAVAAVGETLLDPRPAFVFAADGSHVLYANVAGAALLGASAIGDALSVTFSDLNPLKAQVARLARVLPTDAARLEMLRFGQGVRVTTLTAACRRLNLDDGSRAVLAIAAAGAAGGTLAARAEALVGMLAERDGLAAVATADGKIVAGSDGAETPALKDLIDDAARQGHVARDALTVGGGTRDTQVAPFHADGRALFLVVAAAVARTRAAPPAFVPPEETAPSEPPQAGPAPMASYPAPDAAALEPAQNSATAQPPRVVQFVFEADAEQRFTFVSGELAEVVGAEHAAIVGHPWSTVAAAFGFEGAPFGGTVLWPAADGQTVPVAMSVTRGANGVYRGFGAIRPDERSAALRAPAPLGETAVAEAPAASPPAKIVEEVQAAAADLAQPHHDADEAAQHSIERGTAHRRPRPRRDPVVERAAPPPAPPPAPAPSTSNVVRLEATPTRILPERLTGTERDAFRRIAEALGARQEDAEEIVAAPAAPARKDAGKAPAGDIDTRLLDRLPLGIAVFRDRRTLFANRTLLDLLGYDSYDAFIETGGAEAIFPGSDGLAGSIADGGGKLAARRRDGVSVSVKAWLHAVTWAGATALMLSLSATPKREATDEDALTLELARSEARADELSAILDTATDGVIVIDQRGKIGSMNRAAEALFGIEATEYAGRYFTDLVADESHKAALDYLDGLAANGVASVLNDGREIIGRVPAGGLIPLFMTMGRIGTSDKFAAVLRDITHWKNVEAELIAARRAAEAANTQKSDFLAKISHEIRTPLNAIIGFSEVMMGEKFGPIGNERYRSYLHDIHVSGAHLLSLINDLLDLSKIEAGKVDLAFESVPVNAAIQECVALMQPQANRERIIIRTSLGADVPSVVADPRSLRQILLNLMSNAVKFTRAGGQVIVSSSLEASGEVVVRIRDTGIGMSEKDIETAMKPFRQVAVSRDDREHGTGLGLPLTKALVEANRASFAIDSAPNQGTLVRITFPTTRVLAG